MSMVCFRTVLLALAALLFTHCDARTSAVLMEERMDDCPCTLEMGGRAHNPDKIYMEIDEVSEYTSSSRCTLRKMAPVLSNYTQAADPFCLKAQATRKGSFIIRACIAEDDDDAEMELYNFNRTSCGSDVDHDEIQKQEDIDCEESCSSSCGDSFDASPAPTDFPILPTSSPVSPQSSVQLTNFVVPVSRIFRSLARKVHSVSRLIHGAIVTDEDKLPYVVNIRHFESNRSNALLSLCTGSLIGKRWVLTAGHCDNEPGDIVVVGERFDRNDGDVPKEEGESYVVKKVVRHPDYKLLHNPRDYSVIGVHNNDVALLELEEDVDDTDKIIHLNTDCRYPFPCSHARLSGHGKACADNEKETARVLRTTVSRILDIETCHKILADLGKCFADFELGAEAHICALHDDCGSGLCSGDSGGPLVVRRERIDDDGEDDYFSMDDDDDTIQVQVGVSTWIVDECGAKRRPDVFEPVAAYADWIYETSNGEAKFYPPLEETSAKLKDCRDREVPPEALAVCVSGRNDRSGNETGDGCPLDIVCSRRRRGR